MAHKSGIILESQKERLNEALQILGYRGFRPFYRDLRARSDFCVTEATVRNWHLGRREAPSKYYATLARTFSLSLDWLLLGGGNPLNVNSNESRVRLALLKGLWLNPDEAYQLSRVVQAALMGPLALHVPTVPQEDIVALGRAFLTLAEEYQARMLRPSDRDDRGRVDSLLQVAEAMMGWDTPTSDQETDRWEPDTLDGMIARLNGTVIPGPVV